MKRVLVAMAVVLAAVTSWCLRDEPVVEPPVTPAVEAPARTSAPSPSAPIPTAPTEAPAGDASVVAKGVITITVEREGRPQPGPRVVLRNAEGVEVSGTTDVMGMVGFELPVGPWLVMGPEGLEGERVEVPGRVTLTLPTPRRVEGTVFDAQGLAAAGVPITEVRPRLTIGSNRFSLTALGEPVDSSNVRSVDFDRDELGPQLARTDEAGHFAFESTEEAIVIGASRGEARATAELSLPATGVTLRLEETTLLTVVAPSRVQAIATLYFGKTSVVLQLTGAAQQRVPVGEVQVRALTIVKGTLLRASQQVFVKSGVKNVVELEFSEAPRVSGLVLDGRGTPLAGVTVGLSLAPSNPGSVPRSQERAVTDGRGRFQLVPRLIRGGDPLYEVHLLSPWKEKSVVRLRLGDAAVSVEAVEEK